MADSRKTLAYDGIGFKAATYKIDGVTITYSATSVGGAAATMLNKAVSLAGVDGVVQLCSDGEAVEGKLLLVEPDGYCTLPSALQRQARAGRRLLRPPGW